MFPPDVYEAMLREMPNSNDYRALPGRNNVNILDDGSATRVKIDLFPEYIRNLPEQKRELWDVVGRALCSQEVRDAFVRRLGPGLERRFGAGYRDVGMFPIPILTRDVPKYRITPHTDTKWKGITVQFYLPPDDTTKHIGTIFHERLPDGSMPQAIKMPFSPNTGYAFAVSDNTWHSADPVGPEVKTRDSILHTYFVDSGSCVSCATAAAASATSSPTKCATSCAEAFSHPVALDRRRIPDEAVARPVRDHRLAVHDGERLLHDLVGPVGVFQEMAGRRRGEQMRARLGIEMR